MASQKNILYETAHLIGHNIVLVKGCCSAVCYCGNQGSKIALVPSYLRVPQAAGQVKILLFLVKIKSFPIYANNFCDAGQVHILKYFEAW